MSNPTRWVGIDLRRRRSQIAIIDDEGELTFSRPIVNDVTRFASCSATRTHPMWRLRRPTAGSGSPRCSRRPATTCTSHTRCVRRRSPRPGSRPTRSDAKTLTHLLRCALLPEAYIAPPELRDLRELLRHRATLTRMRNGPRSRTACTRCWPAKSTATCSAKADTSSLRRLHRQTCRASGLTACWR